MRRISARVLSRQSPAAGLGFAPAFADLPLAAAFGDLLAAFAVFVAPGDLRGLLARDVPLAFGFALLFFIMRHFL
ncbi:MAG TPA: hypothetical protein VL175_04765 [Pirellulales bacterium]|nr:hypothetical protein [Pirellulales bacterium]